MPELKWSLLNMFLSLDYIEIDEMYVFVDLSISYFSKAHTPRKTRRVNHIVMLLPMRRTRASSQ